MIFDPRQNVNDEAQFALRFLARGFFTPPRVQVGESWQLDRRASEYSEHMTYRIAALSVKARATIVFDGTRSVRGARFLDSTEHGTMDYQTVLLVPVSLQTTVRTLENAGTRHRSADEAIDVRLRSDGFAPAP